MSVHASAKPPFDPEALEARTQAIGQELFTSAKRAHAHLSALNRWASQVLSWCLADPVLKASVLRFIDVLPSLTTPQQVARHLREYFPTSDLRLPATLRLGAQLARPGLLTHGAVSAVIRQSVEQVAGQFIAHASPDGAHQAIQSLAASGAMCSLDLLGEQVLSDQEADRYLEQCRMLLRESALAYAHLPASTRLVTHGPLVNLSVKPSALTPRFHPISPSMSVREAAHRLAPLLQDAAQRQSLINLDMEQYELRDLTLELAKHLLAHSGLRVPLGVVIQAYLRDAEDVVEELFAWLTAHRQALAIRLVKGAYWDAEVAIAAQRHWPVPVYLQKGETDLAFERLTRRLLAARPLVTTAIASHNIRSIAHAMAVAEALGLAKPELEFQLLYGMGDAIASAIVSLGYPVRVYTPIGELIPGMAYLVRRILENTANESFLRQEFVQERSATELLSAPRIRAAESATPTPHTSAWRGEPPADFSKAAPRAAMDAALASVRAQLGQRYPLLIGAEKIQLGDAMTTRNPAAPREAVGLVARANFDHVLQAVRQATDAQPAWAATPVQERTAILRRAAQLMRERRYELAAWEVYEVGKPWREADADVVEAIDYLDYYCEQMEMLANGKSLIQVSGERNEYRYVPRGVAAVIAPWNFPAAILTGMASAALASGNAVILKPAEPSSVIAAQVASILRQAGVPPGVLHYLPGVGEEVGVSLVKHPGVHAVLFTGSKAVGLSILEACSKVASGQRFIKHVVTEMGGKNAIIVDADADVDAAITGTVQSAFGYAGQKCSAASRLIVHDAIADRFLSRLSAATDALIIGDPADPATEVGPLIQESAKQRLLEAIGHAREVGRVVYQYPASRLPTQGHFVSPTIVTDVPLDDRLARQEFFGPLVCVVRVKSFEDALALANDSDYALTGGVYSRSPSHVELAIKAFDVGNLYINRQITGAVVGRQPFGGHRLSGLGTKAGGPDYLAQLLIPKTICINTTRHGMPLD